MALSRNETKLSDGRGRTNMAAIVPIDLHREIKHLCIERGETLSDFVTRACQAELTYLLVLGEGDARPSPFGMSTAGGPPAQPTGYEGKTPFGGQIPEALAEVVRDHCDREKIGRRIFLIDALRAHAARLGLLGTRTTPRAPERKVIV